MKKIAFSFILALLWRPEVSVASFQDFLLDPFGKCTIESHKEQLSQDFQFEYSIYKSKNPNAKRSVLILPPTGGKNILDKGYAALFCKAGYDSYILENWTGLYDPSIEFTIHQKYQERAQRAITEVMSRIKTEKVSVIGASAGAINFSVTLNNTKVMKRVDKFMSIVSGGPLCKVIAHAGETALKGLRARRMETFQLEDMQEYEEKICENLNWNISKSKPEGLKFGAIISLNDETVLTRFQQNQIEWIKPDFLIESKASHRGTVIRSFLFNRNKIFDFLVN